MISRADIVEAIERHPEVAAEALAALQIGRSNPVTFDSIKPAADGFGLSVAEAAATLMESQGWLDAYAAALNGRGVAIDMRLPAPAVGAGRPGNRFNPNALAAFIPTGQAVRCRILGGNPEAVLGSGCLIGPTLVLTAWHVIAAASPDTDPEPPYGPVRVLLSDGTRRTVTRILPVSKCTPEEYANRFPNTDAAFVGRDDVALLQLSRPDGVRLNYIRLPDTCSPTQAGSDILVLDFPEGRDDGWASGRVRGIPGLSARQKHDASADQGSSGAPCLDTGLQLMGIHQGKWPPAKRLVPLTRFHGEIRSIVEGDIAPEFLWSTDGTLDGELVFGRDLFFEGVAAASGRGRVRGLRIKRLDLAQNTPGLSFSARLLTQLLERAPGRNRLIRVGLDDSGSDLLDAIRDRAAEAGVVVDSEGPPTGVRFGDTTPEAESNERARTLAAGLSAAVEALAPDGLLWIYLDDPGEGIGEARRTAFESFAAAVLAEPRLRLVLAGFETVTSPGLEFADAGDAATPGGPGFLVEHIGWFRREDVRLLIRRAATALDLSLEPSALQSLTDEAVQGLASFGGAFGQSEPDDARTVTRRVATALRARLEHARESAG